MKEETRKKIYKELFPLELTDEIYEQIIDRLLNRLDTLRDNYVETSLMIANEQDDTLNNKNKELDIWQEAAFQLAYDLAKSKSVDDDCIELSASDLLEDAYQKAKKKAEAGKTKEASHPKEIVVNLGEEMTKPKCQNGEKDETKTRQNGECDKSSHPKNTFKISIKAPNNTNTQPAEDKSKTIKSSDCSDVIPGQLSLWDLFDDLDFDGDFEFTISTDDDEEDFDE